MVALEIKLVDSMSSTVRSFSDVHFSKDIRGDCHTIHTALTDVGSSRQSVRSPEAESWWRSLLRIIDSLVGKLIIISKLFTWFDKTYNLQISFFNLFR